MCKFKSGVILKTSCIISQGSNDSHTDLLNALNIEDTAQNAMTKFVRAELLPPNDEWWTDPETWLFHVDQDVVPDWYDTDPEKYETEFKTAVKDWWAAHVLIDKKIDELSSGYYRLKCCEVKKLSKDVQVMCDNSLIQEMHDSSSVQRMYGNSSILAMLDSSSVHKMLDSSSVHKMLDSSSVHKMFDSSSIQMMWDNSSIQKMYSNSSVWEMFNNSSVWEMYDNSSVWEMYDNSSVQMMWDSSSVKEMHDSSIARDYSKGIIHIASESTLKPIIHKNL